jgi:class 3 adenylate cyclase/tetratricopeptide (TPR) repeat protein
LQISGAERTSLAEQRKVVTILFADLSGSTPLAERLDPEELRGVLSSYFGVLSREIRRFGGTIDKYIGDAVMAVFGAPVSHEDDAERAVRAALAMQRAMARENDTLEVRYGVRLTLRIGVNTGEVVAGLLGGEAEAAYTVVGDAVNTAQRVESAAPPDQVLVGGSTYGLTRQVIEFEALAPVTLKGKREPVPVFRAVRPLDERAFAEVPPFVGRAEELRELRAAFDLAHEGQGLTAHLVGEAGVGKSRLVEEWLAGLPRDTLVMRLRCASYERDSTYGLLARLVRRAFGIHEDDEEAAAREAMAAVITPFALPADEAATAVYLEVLGYPARSPVTPDAKRQILVLSLRRSFERQDRFGTFVVVIEDLHSIDAASRAVLAEAVGEVARRHSLVLTTSRDPGPLVPSARVLELRPLAEDDAAEMARQVGIDRIDPTVRGEVLERTGGNPLFIQEVVRTLAAGRAVRMPANVHELLEARLDALRPELKRVAQRAAVVGRTFTEPVIARILPNEQLTPALRGLEREGLIARSGTSVDRTYAFRHALMQEVAYETQLLSERRSIHAAVGTAIEEVYTGRLEEQVDLLAFHFGRGNNDPKAVTWLSRAADRARSLFANDDAIRYFSSAIERAKDGSDDLAAGGLLDRLADVQRIAGRFEDAELSIERARQRIPSATPRVAARLHRKLGLAQAGRGRHSAALDEFTAALNAVADEDDDEAARIHVVVLQIEGTRGELDRARAAGERAILAAQRAGADDVLAEALVQLGILSFQAGRYTDAIAQWERSLETLARVRDPVVVTSTTSAVHSNLGAAYRRLGRYDEALRELQAARSLAEKTGSPVLLGRTFHNIGEVLRSKGEHAAALDAFTRCLEVWEPTGYTPARIARTYLLMGATRLDAGDVVSARRDLTEAERRFGGCDSRPDLPDLHRWIALAALAESDLSEAEQRAHASIEAARALGVRHLEAMAERVLGEIALARGDVERARELLETSRAALAQVGEHDELRRAELALARSEVAVVRA